MKKELRKEYLKTMTQLATAGFGLVAALVWNEAIKSFIDYLFPVGNGIFSKLIYALIVTGLAVLVTRYLGKLSYEAKEDKN